jgi:hypothetical protein
LPHLIPEEFVVAKCENAPGQPTRFKEARCRKTLTVFGSRPGVGTSDRIFTV